MRKLICAALMTMFVICGCGMIQLNQDSKDIIASIMGRRIGCAIAENHAITAIRIAPMAEMLIASDDTLAQIIAEKIRTTILDEISDPMLRDDIDDLMGIIKVADKQSQIDLIRAAARGLLEGVK